MNTRLFLLSAALVTLAASAALAAPTESERYAGKAEAMAQALLSHTGVDFSNRPVSVRAKVDGDGGIRRLEVVSSSGSPEADRAAEAVLKRIVTADPPYGLTDGAVTLNVGRTATATARTGGR